MATSKFGTDRIAGLDSQTAAHLLGDAQLQRAENVNYDVYGAAQPEAADSLIAATTTPSGIGAAYVKTSDYVIRKMDANSVYADDTVVTSSWGGSIGAPIKVVQGRGEALIYDGVRSRVWDGDVIRKLGVMVGTGPYDDDEENPLIYNGDGVAVREGGGTAISNITVTDGVVEVTTTVAHSLVEGDKVYIAAVVGMTEINGAVYETTIVDEDQFTLNNIDGSAWTGYSSGGLVYIGSAGFAGKYKYRVSYTITLPNDRIIESAPTQLYDIAYEASTASGEYSTITATDKVKVRIDGIKTTDVSTYIFDDGTNTIGTDYTVGINVYRTKDLTLADSEAYYLVKQFAHADAYNKPDGVHFYDQTPDLSIVDVWEDGLDGAVNSHDNPPTVRIAVPFANRLYVVDDTNPSRIYPSMGAEYDYYGSGWYYEQDTNVAAMGVLDNRLLVIGHGRAWVHTNGDGIGTWDNVVLPDYPVNQEAVVETPYGVLLATNTGLYLWDGTGATMLSAPVKDDWKTSSAGEWHGAFVGDEAVFSNASDTSGLGYGIKMTGASTATERNVTLSLWRRLSGPYTRLAADSYNGVLLGQTAAGFYALFGAATDRTMTLQGKDHRVGFGRSVTATLDLGPAASYSATLTSNMGDTSTVTFANAKATRMLVQQAFKQMVGQFFSITLTGTGTVYGWTVDGGLR